MKAAKLRRLMAAMAIAGVMPGCASKAPPASTLLDKVTEYAPDGKVVQLSRPDLSAFQTVVAKWTPRQPKVDEIYALEANLPDATGTEGAYIVIFRSGNYAEMRYHEQLTHMPRTNRYYRRVLTQEELTELQAFVKAHPVDEFRPNIHPRAVEKTEIGKTGAGAGGGAATEPAPEPPEKIVFRWTHAEPRMAQSILIDTPGENDHPAIELTRMLARFRDAAPLTCVYVQPVPQNATILYGSPFHDVVQVWTSGTDIRAEISPPLEVAATTEAGTQPTTQPEAPEPSRNWYALRDGEWKLTAPPPPAPPTPPAPTPATTPSPAPRPIEATPKARAEPAATSYGAVVPASAPSTMAATAPAPSPPPPPPTPVLTAQPRLIISNPQMLPATEKWQATPMDKYTVVRHYVPRGPFSVWIRGFAVPGVEFDTDHMWVDKGTRRLYLIHEGTLFAMELPPAVFPD